MSSVFIKRIQELDSSRGFFDLLGIKRGFEKECLRVNKKGMIATTPHPKDLGASLTHPLITTDYSEALLEFITPPLENRGQSFETLMEIHHFTYQMLQDEVLWASSMPCRFSREEEIPIALYGHSNLGKLKHIYRRGLGYRYGRAMQTIAGIHYNFSLSNAFWQRYHHHLQSGSSLQTFISEQYLGLIRNCLRFGWLLPLLFGASPAVLSCFFTGEKPDLQPWGKDSLIGPYATSLRLSDLGYHNKIQKTVGISYNSLDEFLQTMKKAVHTQVPEYEAIGIEKEGDYFQLSDSMLQTEDEHYALVRPKRVSSQDERTLGAIAREGIEYIEVRAIDINPFMAVGIEKEMVFFLDAFLMMCLLMESPPLTAIENQRIGYNQNQIVRYGRQPGLQLMVEEGRTMLVQDWALSLLEKVQIVAGVLDKVYHEDGFTRACSVAKQNLLAFDNLPSAKILQEMKEHQESYFDFAWRWSLKHQNDFRKTPLTMERLEYYQKLAQDSLAAQQALEQKDTLTFDHYLHRYLEEV